MGGPAGRPSLRRSDRSKFMVRSTNSLNQIVRLFSEGPTGTRAVASPTETEAS